MTDSLTFAHLSDPHLSTLDNVQWRQITNKRVLGYLSWKKRRSAEHLGEVLQALNEDLHKTRPDHIVVTGDLTQIGLPDEFIQARRWLESLGRPDQVTVVPGNHDAYVKSTWQQSYAQWEPYLQSDDPRTVSGNPDIATMFPSLRRRGPVAFIGVCSARPTGPFLATGQVGTAQRERIGELLRTAGEQNLFRVVLLHHPPVPGTEKWRKRLTDARQLSSVIGQAGAELVLHGHRHRPQENTINIDGTHIPVIGIPSASAIGHKPGRVAQYYLYRVSRDGQDWKVDISVRTYSAGKGTFEPVDQPAPNASS